jgi:hypothetical protein
LLTVFLAADDEFYTPTTSVGGYGELHYNYKKADGAEASRTLDFHRFVLFFSHSWSEKWSFKAEVELEHNFVRDGQGELELEQAVIDYRASQHFGFQVGVVLAPVGLINLYHEPPLFMSVERPDYAKYIIPTTWFGNGAAIYGKIKGFDYKLTVMEGLDGEKIGLGGIRSGRRKGFKADADDLLYNFRLDFNGINGLRAGGSYTYNRTVNEDMVENPVQIFEGHVKYDNRNLYAVFEIARITYGSGAVEASSGFYFDIGYNIGSLLKTKAGVYPWFRWSEYNTASASRDGSFDPGATKVSKWLAGVSVKPLGSVIFKVEFGTEKRGLDGVQTRLFNLGAGYMF